MFDPLRLMAMTFFADTSLNEKVKNREVTSLPGMIPLPGFNAQPILPQQMEAAGLGSEPGTWPTLPSFDIPPSIFAWVGNNHKYPQPPSKDPFYKPDPSKYQNLKNGDVIDVRPVGWNVLFPELASAWQISYRTESATGNPTADVTTLMIPKKYDGKHVVSWQDWEDSNNLKCAPSYLFSTGIRDPTLDLILTQGWAAIVPDHEGQNSAFAAGRKSGKSTLDSIRAVKQASAQLKFSYEDLVLYGYSGGSIATGFALELQPTYAPDVEIKAASMGGVVASLNDTLNTINKGLFAGFAFAGLYGLAYEYGFGDVLQANLKDDSRARANMVLDHCFTWDIINYLGQDVYDYMKLGEDAINIPEIKGVLEKEKMGFNAPTVPIYIHQGAADEIAPASAVDSLVDFYCQNGVAVEYERDDNVEHLIEMVVGGPNAIKYFSKVFNENYQTKKCSSYKDAIANNGIRSPATDSSSSKNKALWGDFSDYGLPKIAPF